MNNNISEKWNDSYEKIKAFKETSENKPFEINIKSSEIVYVKCAKCGHDLNMVKTCGENRPSPKKDMIRFSNIVIDEKCPICGCNLVNVGMNIELGQ